MTTKNIIKIFSFLLIFAMGFLTMQSCCDSKEKKNDIQTTEIKTESSEGKCGDGKVEKDSTETKEAKCGDGKCGDDKKTTEEKESKCGKG